MFIYDLHCDTLSKCLDNNESLFRNQYQLDLERGLKYDKWMQVFACFIDSIYSGDDAFLRFKRQADLYKESLQTYSDYIVEYNKKNAVVQGKCNSILSVEGGHCLDGKLENLDVLESYNVKLLTLVWNGDNELGSGVLGDKDRGITEFGKSVIKKAEDKKIIIDIAHLNDTGISDIINLTSRPIISSHSNLRKISNNKRNLTDEQFKFLVECNGLCGINFYPPFICGELNYEPNKLHKMIEAMLDLGGENILSLGSDFDGADMPSFIKGIESLYKLQELMVKWFGNDITQKIFYKNAFRFFNKNIF